MFPQTIVAQYVEKDLQKNLSDLQRSGTPPRRQHGVFKDLQRFENRIHP